MKTIKELEEQEEHLRKLRHKSNDFIRVRAKIQALKEVIELLKTKVIMMKAHKDVPCMNNIITEFNTVIEEIEGK